MKKVLLATILLGLIACGGGGGSSSGTGASAIGSGSVDCSIIMNTLTIENGSECNFTTEDAATYSLSPGEVSCTSNGTLVYGSNQLSGGGNGILLNGLTFVCVAP